MNNHKNYNSGFRKELLTISLACGFVPFKCLPLLNPNKTSMQHIVNVFVEDGDFEKYHNKVRFEESSGAVFTLDTSGFAQPALGGDIGGAPGADGE